jgi:cyclopropane-fatty-acyl-phospholipid synthase
MAAIRFVAGQAGLPRHFAACWARVERMRAGRLEVVMPDGRRFQHDGGAPGPHAEIVVHDARLFGRILRQGDAGFTDGYVDGLWTSPDLQALYDLIHLEAKHLMGARAAWAVRVARRIGHLARRNTRRGARRNVAAHYDLGNAFYELWLDRSMTYSSALFATGDESLEDAQAAKYDAILRRIDPPPGGHVLEIGCGWGGFAMHAAGTRDLRVTGLTISGAQAAYARARVKGAGLADRVEIALTDYRDARGSFDGIASIEMLEAVGPSYWPAYFATLRDRLKPGARAALQLITVPDLRWKDYSGSVDFIQRHVFPGGSLIPPARLRAEAARAGLEEQGQASVSDSYSCTLRRWHARFDAAWEEIARLGFDDRFRRVWETYLTACAAGFAHGTIDVVQTTLRRPA